MRSALRPVVVAAAYGSVVAATIVVGIETDLDERLAFVLPIFVLTHLALGASVLWWPRAWVLLALPVLVAVPFSDWNCDDGLGCIGEPVALFVLLAMLLAAAPLVGVGYALARLVSRWSRRRRSGVVTP